MYIPFDSLMPHLAEQPYFKRKRLTQKNSYGLAAGDYLIHDLYPLNPMVGQDIYFTVERYKTAELVLTARFDLTTEPPELFLSPRHLQGPDALQAMDFLCAVINDPQVGEAFDERLQHVFMLHLKSLEDFLEEHPEEAQEMFKKLSLVQADNQLVGALMQAISWPVEAEPAEDEKIIPFERVAKGKKSKKAKTQAPSGGAVAAKNFSGNLVLRIDLQGAPLRIWRRLQVPANLSLTQLHQVLQMAMGWHNCHLWQFTDQLGEFYLPEDPDGADPDQHCIGEFLKQPRDLLNYEYDFGDCWMHRLELEQVLPGQAEAPQVLKAKNACPPEDCGGVWGYADLLDVLKKKRKNKADKELLEWVGGDFDPEVFELKSVNLRLQAWFGT